MTTFLLLLFWVSQPNRYCRAANILGATECADPAMLELSQASQAVNNLLATGLDSCAMLELMNVLAGAITWGSRCCYISSESRWATAKDFSRTPLSL